MCRHFVITLPGSWECRHTIQNMLQIAWMDVFEQAGWTILSNWNSANSAAESSVHPSAPCGVACNTTDDSAAEVPSNVAATAVASDGTAGVAAADLTEFKGDCTNFLLSKRAETGMSAIPFFSIAHALPLTFNSTPSSSSPPAARSCSHAPLPTTSLRNLYARGQPGA